MSVTFSMEEIEQLTNEVYRLCEEYPEAKYITRDGHKHEACFYSKFVPLNGPKTPGCIIGQAVRNIFPEKFSIIEGREANKRICCMGDVIELLNRQIDLHHPLKTIQLAQDRMNSWGDALNLANNYVKDTQNV